MPPKPVEFVTWRPLLAGLRIGSGRTLSPERQKERPPQKTAAVKVQKQAENPVAMCVAMQQLHSLRHEQLGEHDRIRDRRPEGQARTSQGARHRWGTTAVSFGLRRPSCAAATLARSGPRQGPRQRSHTAEQSWRSKTSASICSSVVASRR